MSPTICPTVTTNDPHEYRAQMERLVQFAARVHIDLADGQFAPHTLIPIDQVWWPGGMRADIHVMYKSPLEHISALLALGPQLIILHAEADGDFLEASRMLRSHGCEAGIALLQQTPVETIFPALEFVDHVLVFSGSLGQFGGTADLQLLDKVKALKAHRPQLEVGWDGGINDQNARALVSAGVDVLNVGGFIQRSADPATAYAKLEQALNG